jgi:hypothetical protein
MTRDSSCHSSAVGGFHCRRASNRSRRFPADSGVVSRCRAYTDCCGFTYAAGCGTGFCGCTRCHSTFPRGACDFPRGSGGFAQAGSCSDQT